MFFCVAWICNIICGEKCKNNVYILSNYPKLLFIQIFHDQHKKWNEEGGNYMEHLNTIFPYREQTWRILRKKNIFFCLIQKQRIFILIIKDLNISSFLLPLLNWFVILSTCLFKLFTLQWLLFKLFSLKMFSLNNSFYNQCKSAGSHSSSLPSWLMNNKGYD